jgi:hypothetical protein
MSKVITEVHEIKVYNESPRLFLVKSFYCYELYISNMQEYMGDRFEMVMKTEYIWMMFLTR